MESKCFTIPALPHAVPYYTETLESRLLSILLSSSEARTQSSPLLTTFPLNQWATRCRLPFRRHLPHGHSTLPTVLLSMPSSLCPQTSEVEDWALGRPGKSMNPPVTHLTEASNRLWTVEFDLWMMMDRIRRLNWFDGTMLLELDEWTIFFSRIRGWPNLNYSYQRLAAYTVSFQNFPILNACCWFFRI